MDTYEKKYKEALERARKELQACGTLDCDCARQMFRLFPELKESEDERIKKDLISFFKDGEFLYHKKEEIVEWLEKQGEKLPVGFYYVNSEGKKFYSDTFKYGNVTLHVEKQGEKPQGKTALEAINEEKVDNQNCVKTNDKVEPKFKVGDFESGTCEQKLAWSEEDEERLQSCLNILQAKGIMGVTETINTKWLKSLKDRYTWKPSDKQLDALHDAAAYVDKSMFPYPKGILMKLYKQLKKLKGE